MAQVRTREDVSKLQKALEAMEDVAEDILTAKQQMVDFDRRRQSNREALRAMSDREKQHKLDKKTLLFAGDVFIKLPSPAAKSLIERDQSRLEKELATLQEQIKRNTLKLHELEGREVSEASPFFLRPMKLSELGVTPRSLSANIDPTE